MTDAGAIAHVHVATWRTTYRGMVPDEFLDALDESAYEARWRRTINDSGIRVYVAEEGGGVVGFASGGRERAGDPEFSGELYALYVLDSAQRRGHGRRLVRAVVDGLREMDLADMIVWVLRDNTGARHFYEVIGGAYLREQPLTIGSFLLQEVSYGWRRLVDVRV